MSTILESLIGQDAYDVVIFGIVDNDEEPAEFLPVLDAVFLLIGDVTVRLLRDDATARLRISQSTDAVIPFELETGQRVCRSSIGKFTFANPNADNRVQQFVLHGANDDSAAALEMVLQSGQILFFDPTFFDGINFGGVEQREIWRENSSSQEATTIR